MSKPKKSDAVWHRLIDAARSDSDATCEPAPSMSADQVVAAWRAQPPRSATLARRGSGERLDDRLVGVSAVVALAASLLLVVADWDLLRDVIAPRPEVLEACITVEPLP